MLDSSTQQKLQSFVFKYTTMWEGKKKHSLTDGLFLKLMLLKVKLKTTSPQNKLTFLLYCFGKFNESLIIYKLLGWNEST